MLTTQKTWTLIKEHLTDTKWKNKRFVSELIYILLKERMFLIKTMPHGKINSVQEACAKCFAVHMLKFEIFLQVTWKIWNKEHRTLIFLFFIYTSSILMHFVLFFHVVFKISNFDMWNAKHLAQVSCTELNLCTTPISVMGSVTVV